MDKMMIPIDDTYRGYFVDMCRDFAAMRLQVVDDGALESVQIFFPADMRKALGYDKQFATIHYMGDSAQKPAFFEYFEVRFYVGALEKAAITDIVAARDSWKKEWNGGGDKTYYRRNNILFTGSSNGV